MRNFIWFFNLCATKFEKKVQDAKNRIDSSILCAENCDNFYHVCKNVLKFLTICSNCFNFFTKFAKKLVNCFAIGKTKLTQLQNCFNEFFYEIVYLLPYLFDLFVPISGNKNNTWKKITKHKITINFLTNRRAVEQLRSLSGSQWSAKMVLKPSSVFHFWFAYWSPWFRESLILFD